MDESRLSPERLKKLGLSNLRETLPQVMAEMVEAGLIKPDGLLTETGRKLIKEAIGEQNSEKK